MNDARKETNQRIQINRYNIQTVLLKEKEEKLDTKMLQNSVKDEERWQFQSQEMGMTDGEHKETLRGNREEKGKSWITVLQLKTCVKMRN